MNLYTLQLLVSSKDTDSNHGIPLGRDNTIIGSQRIVIMEGIRIIFSKHNNYWASPNHGIMGFSQGCAPHNLTYTCLYPFFLSFINQNKYP